VKILGISGSLRRDSHNSRLLRSAAEHFGADVEFEVWEGLKAVPPYDEDDDTDDVPAGVAQLRAALAGADAVLFATPEYNSSIPGQLKNALDWVSRPLATNALRNKPVAVVGASSGAFGAVWSQAELRKVLATIGARVVDCECAVGHAGTRFAEDGRLADEKVREQLEEVVQDLLAAARARGGSSTVAVADSQPAAQAAGS
jgi:chromate reductase, NAD(P)H dehydrogenase (quinone)